MNDHDVSKQTEQFLKGPIPLRWIRIANQSGRSALIVGLVLWFRRGLTKKDDLDLNLSRLSEFGLSRHSASRGLRNLERHGLALVKRFKGKKSQIQILKIKPTENNPT